jgi:hypothetical protein
VIYRIGSGSRFQGLDAALEHQRKWKAFSNLRFKKPFEWGWRKVLPCATPSYLPLAIKLIIEQPGVMTMS